MIMLECVTWVPHIWYELQHFCSALSLLDAPLTPHKPPHIPPHMPDDVVVDILRRLPAKSVMQCRRVCKKWYELTSSPYFVELHMKGGAVSTPPSLFVNWRERCNCFREVIFPKIDFRVRDDQGEGEIVKKVRTKKYWNAMAKFEPSLVGSCDGLLLFVARYYDRSNNFPPSRFRAFVLNPVTQELLFIDMVFEIMGTCGIYRDPSTHEYKVLLTNNWCDPISFYVIGLKSKQCKKILTLKDCEVRPCYPCAVASKGCLHWVSVQTNNIPENSCEKLILAFNTKREEINFHPHPGSKSSNCHEGHGFMHLVETREHLWFFNVLVDRIQVWVVRDYDNWTWDSRNSVSLDWCVRKFPYEFVGRMYLYDVSVIEIRNNVELLICWSDRGMFWYNLEKHTIRRASVFKEKDSVDVDNCLLRCTPYIKTFARIIPAEEE